MTGKVWSTQWEDVRHVAAKGATRITGIPKWLVVSTLCLKNSWNILGMTTPNNSNWLYANIIGMGGWNMLKQSQKTMTLWPTLLILEMGLYLLRDNSTLLWVIFQGHVSYDVGKYTTRAYTTCRAFLTNWWKLITSGSLLQLGHIWAPIHLPSGKLT